MPKVSVIVPVYGVEKYIEHCARSLFEQSIDDIEYIFIDDCTFDKSIDVLKTVLKEYPKRESQVVIHRMEQNSGQAKVREWGILNATGDYIIHCDSDDWVDNNLYQKLYEKAIEDASDIVICDYYYVVNNNTRKHIKSCNNTNKEAIINDLINEEISWSLCNKLVRREKYLDNDFIFPKDNMGEDMAITFQLILRADIISFVPDAFYYYRRNLQSVSNTLSEEAVWNKFMQVYKNTEIVIYSFKKYGLDKHYNMSFIKWNVRKTLWKITYKQKFRNIWQQTYPELFPSLFFSSLISFQDKTKVILTYIGIYPKYLLRFNK